MISLFLDLDRVRFRKAEIHCAPCQLVRRLQHFPLLLREELRVKVTNWL